nr:hypothetical protein Itr_chr14CG08430 [Ipomoea trifida]
MLIRLHHLLLSITPYHQNSSLPEEMEAGNGSRKGVQSHQGHGHAVVASSPSPLSKLTIAACCSRRKKGRSHAVAELLPATPPPLPLLTLNANNHLYTLLAPKGEKVASPLPSASSQPTSSNLSPSTPSAASSEPIEVPVPDPVGDVSASVDSLPSSASHTFESGATVSTQPADDLGSLPAGSGPSSGNSAGPQVDDSSVGSVVSVLDSIAASRPKRNRKPNPKYFN